MNIASATPASVACTPDLSTAAHITTPMRMYAVTELTWRQFIRKSTTRQTVATARAVIDRSVE